MCPRILVIDDDPQASALLGTILENEGTSVALENDAIRGLESLKSNSVDVLFADLRMSGRNGSEVLREARKCKPTLPVVVTTACGSVESTVNAFRLGAVDYLVKPFRADQVSAALARAFAKTEQPQLQESSAKATIDDLAKYGSGAIVAVSPAMRQVAEKCQRIASSTLPVLIVGELGVGKERVVRLIHSLSSRREGPFVKVNCEAVQESQLVEMFFGEEGAANGAGESSRCGLIERAANGILFLHNVTGLPRWMQESLLDAATGGVFFRKGSSEPAPFRARVAASTLHDPAESVKKGDLLDELFCYLGVVSLDVPPLRYRREDIRPLVDALVHEAGCDPSLGDQWSRLSLTEEARQLLEAYDWPGNIYELSNFIRRVFVFSGKSEVTAAHVAEMLPPLPTLYGPDTITVPFVGNLKLIERAIVAEVINRTHGNKAAAARFLGLHRKTLYRIIENEADEPPRRASG